MSAYRLLQPACPGHNAKLVGLKHQPVLPKKLLYESQYEDPYNRPILVIPFPGSSGTPNLVLEVLINIWEDVLSVQFTFHHFHTSPLRIHQPNSSEFFLSRQPPDDMNRVVPKLTARRSYIQLT